jgi:MFS family permease
MYEADRTLDPSVVEDQFRSDPVSIIRNSPMGNFQIALVVVLFCLYALDGYDLLAVAFALPGIRVDLKLPPNILGVIASVGLIGSGAGAFLIAPLSDRFGRRPIMLVSLVLAGCGMVVCTIADGQTALVLGRAITGLGVGALLPGITALAAEYSNDRVRNRVTVLITVGFSVGGLVGGNFAAALLSHWSWRSVFLCGSIGTFSAVIISALLVPESIEFLVATRPVNALKRINSVLRRMAKEPIARLESMPVTKSKAPIVEIFKQDLLVTTTVVTLTYALHGATFYYCLNWLSKIATDIGYTAAGAAHAFAWCSGGGLVGALLSAFLATRIRIQSLIVFSLVASTAALLSLATIHHMSSEFLVASGLVGVALYCGQSSLYAYMMRAFPTRARASGAGFVTGVGRFGGIASPTISGLLFASGLSNAEVTKMMAMGSLCGAAILLSYHIFRRKT